MLKDSTVFPINTPSFYLLPPHDLSQYTNITPEVEGEPTEIGLAPGYQLDRLTSQFVNSHGLVKSVSWLHFVASIIFPGANYEITMLPSEDEGEGEGETLLALKVYGNLSVSEFRRRRHRICDLMLAAGHNRLYDMIGVFQRRVIKGGWKAISWYGTISTS